MATMSLRLLPSLSLAPLMAAMLLACQGMSPAKAPGDAPVEAAAGKQEGNQDPAAKRAAEEQAKEKEKKDKEEARKKQQKELRGKRRELVHMGTEQRIAELERASRQAGIDAAMLKTAADLEQAQKTLKDFLEDVKPRELEEKKMSVDQSTYRAEHQKDEFGELTAMYEADEFARTTKELVLKRGRRELEMAERYLAVARKEAAHFEAVTLPLRERELKQKVDDAQLERKKVELDAQKAKIEFALAIKKAEERRADLEEEIAELQATLAQDKADDKASEKDKEPNKEKP